MVKNEEIPRNKRGKSYASRKTSENCVKDLESLAAGFRQMREWGTARRTHEQMWDNNNN